MLKGIKKMEKDKVTVAKQVSIIELVRNAGYTPVKRGSVYVLKEHDSFVIFPNTNSFCHYSQVKKNGYVGGSTIDFCMRYMGMSFNDTLDYLCNSLKTEIKKIKPNVKKDCTNEMMLPEKNKDNKRVIAYLCKSRGIDINVVNYFIKNNRLYESKDNHNCVFVTYDENEKPVYAFLRGTGINKSFKLDVKGSRKQEAFPLYRKGSDKVLAFEAPIDMLSYMTLFPNDNNSLISLGCLSPKGLYHFLERHSDIKNVSLILDNDEPGIMAVEGITEELIGKGYKVFENELSKEMFERGIKDVNEYLIDNSCIILGMMNSKTR